MFHIISLSINILAIIKTFILNYSLNRQNDYFLVLHFPSLIYHIDIQSLKVQIFSIII